MNVHMEQLTWKKCKKKEGLGKRVIIPERNSVLFTKSKYTLLLAVQKISLARVGGGQSNESSKRPIFYKYLKDFTGGSTMIRILLITWVIFTLTWVLDNVLRWKQTIWYSLHYNSYIELCLLILRVFGVLSGFPSRPHWKWYCSRCGKHSANGTNCSTQSSKWGICRKFFYAMVKNS